MMDQFEALMAAKGSLQASADYAPFDFQKVVVLRLPGGWRIPFEVYLRAERIHDWLIILFVAEDGKIEVEWDTLKRIPQTTELYQSAKERPLPALPVLEDVQQMLASTYTTYGISEYVIEQTEPVWSHAEQDRTRALTRYWRLVLLRHNGERAVAYAGYKHEAPDLSSSRARGASDEPATPTLFVSEPQIRSRQVAYQWNLGRAKFRRKAGYLRVNLKDSGGQATPLARPLNLWTIWTCISALTDRLCDWGYDYVALHHVIIKLVDLTEAKPQFDDTDKVPTITFPSKGGSPEELTIILHELGHALWWLLYTRPPLRIDDNSNDAHLLKGIQEGFCDYLAATMVAGEHKRAYVRIGHHLEHQIEGLPRHINGHQPAGIPAFRELHHQIEIHEIGLKWANFLWAIRVQLGPHAANQVILRAHLKPLLLGHTPVNLLAAYLKSLENTAGFFQIHFAGWKALTSVHGLDF